MVHTVYSVELASDMLGQQVGISYYHFTLQCIQLLTMYKVMGHTQPTSRRLHNQPQSTPKRQNELV